MRKSIPAILVAAMAVLGAAAPAASAKERLLTLYSPRIHSLPYVHDTHNVPLLKADGNAPSEPGYILGYKEMALVDSKDPKAKPLPIAKMKVHHFSTGRRDASTRRREAAGAARASSADAARSIRSAAPR